MTGVRQQSQALRENAADDLGEHETGYEDQRDGQSALADASQVMGVVMASVPMAMPVVAVAVVVMAGMVVVVIMVMPGMVVVIMVMVIVAGMIMPLVIVARMVIMIMVIMVGVIVAGMIMPLVIVARMVIMIMVIMVGVIVLARSVRVGACVRHGNHLSLTCLATDQEVYPRWPNPTRRTVPRPKPSA
ncbi:MAG: hypothetical protein OXK16_03320 [bacterium]|nr:hypothetical protein [bacterium]